MLARYNPDLWTAIVGLAAAVLIAGTVGVAENVRGARRTNPLASALVVALPMVAAGIGLEMLATEADSDDTTTAWAFSGAMVLIASSIVLLVVVLVRSDEP